MELEYLLLNRRPISLSNGLIFYQHSLEEICEGIGYDLYSTYGYTMCKAPVEFEKLFEEDDIDYRKISYYQLFRLLMIDGVEDKKDAEEVLSKFLKFIFNADDFMRFNDSSQKIKESYRIKQGENWFVLNNSNFHELRQVFMNIFGLKEPKKKYYTSKLLQELEEEEEAEAKKKEAKVTIFSVCSSLVANKHSKYNYENVFKLSPFQILNLHKEVDKNNRYDLHMLSAYNGKMSLKPSELEKMYWANKLR